MVDGQYQPLDEADLKKQLYNWATKPSGEGGLRVPAGEEDKEKYIYNTIAPVEKDKGYYGYGVLWWQIDKYKRTTFHVYDSQGCPINEPTLYIDGCGVKLDVDNDRKYNCKKNGVTFNTYGYIVMLENIDHTCNATAINYTNPDGPKYVKLNQENDVYLGTRPEFIFAKKNNTIGSNIKGTIAGITQGEYYVIATGGGRFRSC